MVHNSAIKLNKSVYKPIAIILFGIGLGLTLFINLLSLWVNLEGMSFWGYPEALAFDSSLTTNARLVSLKCPIILAPWETGNINVLVKNPNDEPITTWVSAHTSMPNMHENMVRDTQNAFLEPKGKTTFYWQVNKDNIINKRTMIVRVFLRLTEQHPPARTKHCGIIALDLWGLSGKTIAGLFFFIGHLLQCVGIWLYWSTDTLQQSKSSLATTIITALGLLSLIMTYGSVNHSWVFSLVGLLLSLLFFFTSLGYGFGFSGESDA